MSAVSKSKPIVTFVNWKKFLSLSWFSPHPAIPHGAAGVGALLLGFYVYFGALTGPSEHSYSITGEINFVVVFLFAGFAAANAVAGILIVNKAPQHGRNMFKLAGMLQLFLTYFVFRFAFNSTNLQIFDLINSIGIVLTILTMAKNIVSMTDVLPNKALMYSVLFGVCCLFLMAGYPLQVAVQGQTWLDCVYTKYPLQQAGFIYYVYIPAITGLSLTLFLATLEVRGIISAPLFALLVFVFVVVLLVSTVLRQEVLIPFVSTQRLVIQCPSVPGSLLDAMGDLTDFSAFSRRMLTRYFGCHFKDPRT